MKDYRIICDLGEGGFGKIQLAEREGSGSLCVVKKLKDEVAAEASATGRFMREAQVGAMLDHANIARLIDARFEDGELIVCTEFVAGQDLDAIVGRLRRDAKLVPPELSVTAMLSVLDGLHYAHELAGPEGRPLGLVHRDVAPKNVMIGYGGEVKLIDFGIARADVGAFRTTPGMIIGTLRYLAPEQALGQKVDRRADLYSVAAVLFELLCGRPLFSQTELDAILVAIAKDVPPALTTINPRLPRALDAVIARALDKDPNRRHPTALELSGAIKEAVPSLVLGHNTKIGDFVSGLFPEAKQEMATRIANARRREVIGEETRVVEPEMFAPTRVLAAPPKIKGLAAALGLAAIAVMGSAWLVAHDRRGDAVVVAPPAVEPSPAPAPAPRVEPRPIESEESPPPPDPPEKPKKLRAAKPIEAVPPEPPPPPKRIDPRIAQLREQLRAVKNRDGKSDVFALSQRIEEEAGAVENGELKRTLQRRARTAGIAGDLDALAGVIDDLEQALRSGGGT